MRKIAGCACAGNARNVSPQLRVSDADMHHGTCVTHVPWCMPGSPTSGFLWSRWRGNVSCIPGACATRNCTYLVRGPFVGWSPHNHINYQVCYSVEPYKPMIVWPVVHLFGMNNRSAQLTLLLKFPNAKLEHRNYSVSVGVTFLTSNNMQIRCFVLWIDNFRNENMWLCA